MPDDVIETRQMTVNEPVNDFPTHVASIVMATVRLRVGHGCILEELPPVCLYCGRDVKQFTVVESTIGERDIQLRVPLCRTHSEHGFVRDLEVSIGNGLMRIGALSGGLLGIGLLAAGAALASNEQVDENSIPISGVDPDFVDELRALRRRREREFADRLTNALTTRSTPVDPNAAVFAGLDRDADGRPAPIIRVERRRASLLPILFAGSLIAALAVGGIVAIVVLANQTLQTEDYDNSDAYPAQPIQTTNWKKGSG